MHNGALNLKPRQSGPDVTTNEQRFESRETHETPRTHPGASEGSPPVWSAYLPDGWTFTESVHIDDGPRARAAIRSTPVAPHITTELFIREDALTETADHQEIRVTPERTFSGRNGYVRLVRAHNGEALFLSAYHVSEGRAFVATGTWNSTEPDVEDQIRTLFRQTEITWPRKPWERVRTLHITSPNRWLVTQDLTLSRWDGLANVTAVSTPTEPPLESELVDMQRRDLRREFRRYKELERGTGTLSGGHKARFLRFEWEPERHEAGAISLPVVQLQLYFDNRGRRFRVTSTRTRSFDWLTQEEELWEAIAGLLVVGVPQ